ncbi:alpha/beta hydrolase family protein [Bacillus salacetis]|uniref:alpha/beta hydrolase family protein n=1 Tax=Bacillus salacetis TaxID=2315464 RepID=UPI003BA2ECAA
MYTKEGLEEVFIKGIRCLLAKPEKDNGHTLIFYHGWGSIPENQAFSAKILASYGFTVILPEIIHHGTRNPFPNPFDTEVLQKNFWKVVLHSVEEAEGLISCAVKSGLAKEGKICLIGSSTGGVIASGVFVEVSSITSLVTLNGSPAWEETEHLWRKSDGRPPAAEEELAQIRKYDPINRLENLKQRPVLMLHGSHDERIPSQGPKKFYDEAKKINDFVQYREYWNVTHTISLNMMEEMINWLMEIHK